MFQTEESRIKLTNGKTWQRSGIDFYHQLLWPWDMQCSVLEMGSKVRGLVLDTSLSLTVPLSESNHFILEGSICKTRGEML